METPDKPNVEVDGPEDKPSLEDLGAGPAERAVFGQSPYGAMIRVLVAAIGFIVIVGSIFYFLNQ